MPGVSSGASGQTDIVQQWEGKGFGFVWDEPIPEGLRFSGVAYGCTINDFYANLEIAGPLGDGTNIDLIGSATMDGLPIVGLQSSSVYYYALDVPLSDTLDVPDADCLAQYTVRLSVEVDLQANAASITDATGMSGSVTCTKEGVTVSAPIPVPSQLPMPRSIRINVLDTDACLQDLQSLP